MRSTCLLVGAEQAALIEHGVHQRGFAVIDVRNDGDIANEAGCAAALRYDR